MGDSLISRAFRRATLPSPAGRTRWRPGGAHGSRPLGDLLVDEVGVDDVTRFDAGYRAAQAFRVSRRAQQVGSIMASYSILASMTTGSPVAR